MSIRSHYSLLVDERQVLFENDPEIKIRFESHLFILWISHRMSTWTHTKDMR